MATKAWAASGDYALETFSLEVNDIGVVKIDETFTCKDRRALSSVLGFKADNCSVDGIDKEHAIITNKSFNRMEADLWRAVVSYQTIINPDVIDNQDYYKFKCFTKTNSEPIQTHPRFLEFAWPPGKNGAFYNPQTGDFEEFRIIHEQAPNAKAGITDYLCPIVTYTLRKIIEEEKIEVELSKLNHIERPVKSRVLPRYKRRTWLRTSVDLNLVARGLYECNITWSLSGPWGWNKRIYRSLY
jgi:hypothetical protein